MNSPETLAAAAAEEIFPQSMFSDDFIRDECAAIILRAIERDRAELLAKLEADLPSIKDAANECAAGNPPEGYTELEQASLNVADACYLHGLNAVETAVSNWIYDQRQATPAHTTKECNE